MRRRRRAGEWSWCRCRRPRRASRGRVRHRSAGQAGEQILDRELGHPGAGRARRGADVRQRRAGSASRRSDHRAAAAPGRSRRSPRRRSRRYRAHRSAQPGRRRAPRAVLTRIARRAHARAARPRRSGDASRGVSGQCRLTKSLSASSSSSVGVSGRADRHPEARRRVAPPRDRCGRSRRCRAPRRATSAPSQPRRLPGPPRSGARVGGRLGQAPRGREQQREGEVGGRLGQHVGRDADRNPARARQREVDVVGPDRVVRDRPQARRSVEQRGRRRARSAGTAVPRRRRRPLAGPPARGASAPSQTVTSCAPRSRCERVAGSGARDEDRGHPRILAARSRVVHGILHGAPAPQP